jgi:hypothetical protein
MKRSLLATAAFLAALCLPSPAAARVVELGENEREPAASNCPADPCLAVYGVTGYQGRSGSLASPFVIRRSGHVVAFTVVLPELTDAQIDFFDDAFGGGPRVRLAVLRKGKRRKRRLDHRLVGQSAVFEVDRYLGSSPTFVLAEPLRVRRGNIVAITVPTWLPALSTDPSGRNWWRSSRPRGRCGGQDETAPPSAQEDPRELVRYGCTYSDARLLYTVTYIPENRPTARDEPPAR